MSIAAVVLACLAVVGAGAGVAYLLTSDAGSDRSAADVASVTQAAAQEVATVGLSPTATTSATVTTIVTVPAETPGGDSSHTPPPVSPGEGSGDDVDEGPTTAGWIAQLGSFRFRRNAEREAQRLTALGRAAAKVLHSDGYVELRRGFWVTYAGPYGEYGDAARAAKRSKVSGAYGRRLTPHRQ